MEGLLAVVENIGRFVILLGGALSVVFLAYAGILWMTSIGDPQKVAQARGALIGVLAGLIIVGIAFIVPGVISELIIEPAGGSRIEAGISAYDCDGLLKRQLVVQEGARNADRMNVLIGALQAKYEDCDPDIWAPKAAKNIPAYAGLCTPPPPGHRAILTPAEVRVGGITVPGGLVQELTPTSFRVVEDSKRASAGNVLVLWVQKPTDYARCWVYFNTFGTWRSNY